jgi:hypothetical protein
MARVFDPDGMAMGELPLTLLVRGFAFPTAEALIPAEATVSEVPLL